MKITLNLPDGPQLDLVQLGAQLEIPLEEVVVSCMAVGTQVISNNPELREKIKKQWKANRK